VKPKLVAELAGQRPVLATGYKVRRCVTPSGGDQSPSVASKVIVENKCRSFSVPAELTGRCRVVTTRRLRCVAAGFGLLLLQLTPSHQKQQRPRPCRPTLRSPVGSRFRISGRRVPLVNGGMDCRRSAATSTLPFSAYSYVRPRAVLNCRSGSNARADHTARATERSVAIGAADDQHFAVLQ